MRAIEDDVIKNIVSCRNFTFPPPSPKRARDPAAALEALAKAFPACISTSIDVTGAMEIKAKAEGLTRVSRSGGRSDVYLCDCSPAEVQRFRDSQAK
jgi:hypothetical protein